MKALVLHASLNVRGGGEIVCSTLINFLVEQGIEVGLLTVDKTDWEILLKTFGFYVRPDYEYYIVKRRITSFKGVANTFPHLFLYVVRSLSRMLSGEWRLVINTSTELLPIPAHINYFNALPYLCSRSLADSTLHLLGRMLKIRKPALVLNSYFLARHLRLRHSFTVINPPLLRIKKKMHVGGENNSMKVLTVARIREGKNLEAVIKLSRAMPDAIFIVAGTLDVYNMNYVRRILRMRPENLRIVLNPERNKIEELYASARVFLSANPLEAFGLSVAEAMSCGAIPVVPRSGGHWEEILGGRDGLYGFGYSDERELLQKVRFALAEYDSLVELRRRARIRVRRYTPDLFKIKFFKLIKRVLNNRI